MSEALSLSLYNTLSRQKTPLVPRTAGEISLYVCGVTPYDKLHIGHARAFLTYDALRRVLENRGLKVVHVQNVTDIDDKIIARASEVGRDPLELASSFHDESLVELARLDILPAHHYPRVTGHINPILTMIEKLEQNGYAYERGGDVFFDVSKDEDYGKLSGQKPDELSAGTRVDAGIVESKDDPADFALWKSAKAGEPAWESRYGNGRPGWHIECSAMALELLGEGFDIHGGARELVFPHHENEIAQSESSMGDGHEFAKTWWHCGELRVDGAKMSKSLNNFITLDTALEWAPKNVWRLLFLQTHPRSPLDYNEEKLVQFKSSWNRIKNALENADSSVQADSEAAKTFETRFNGALDDDLNTPEALAAVFDAVSDINRGAEADLGGAAKRAMEVLGFSFEAESVGDALTPKLLDLLIEVRQNARERRDFAASDAIRIRLGELGIVLEDGIDGTSWKMA